MDENEPIPQNDPAPVAPEVTPPVQDPATGETPIQQPVPVDVAALRAQWEAEDRPRLQRDVEDQIRRSLSPQADQPAALTYEQSFYDEGIDAFAARIRKETMAEFMQLTGGLLAPVAQQQFVAAVDPSLNADGQEYLTKLAQSIGIPDPSRLDEVTRDAFRRSALHYQNEKAAARPKLPQGQERPYSNNVATITAEDRKTYGPYIEKYGEERFLKLKRDENPD